MSTVATSLSDEAAANLPRHVAVIMDGNGCFAHDLIAGLSLQRC
jgi:undecaprenyl pyrophosphate synthase